MNRSPVAHHKAFKAPVAFKDLIQKIVILARPATVHEIVGTHDRARISTLDCKLEGEEIRLAHRFRRNGYIDRCSLALLVVDRKMLDRGDDAVRFDPLDTATPHYTL